MNIKPVINLQRALIFVLLAGGFFSSVAIANPASNASGELLVAKDVTLNGATASPGLTVLSGSRIKTNLGGRVTVNLSKLGRVTLGPDTEVVLTFSEGIVGGELLSGWMVISAPKGVRIAHLTADGVVVADGAQSSLLTIDVTSGSTRVESSGANIFSGNKKEFVAAGEELEFSHSPVDSDSVIARRPIAASESSVANRSATEALGLASLLTAGVRGAVEGLTLNHSRMPFRAGDRVLDRTIKQASSPDYMRIRPVQEQIITCGVFNENCAGCSINPEVVIARPRRTTEFIVSFNKVKADSLVSVRPFFSSACFRITPAFPQQIPIPPGGATPFTINASMCPANAGRLPQNSLILIQTNTCGTRATQVIWLRS